MNPTVSVIRFIPLSQPMILVQRRNVFSLLVESLSFPELVLNLSQRLHGRELKSPEESSSHHLPEHKTELKGPEKINLLTSGQVDFNPVNPLMPTHFYVACDIQYTCYRWIKALRDVPFRYFCRKNYICVTDWAFFLGLLTFLSGDWAQVEISLISPMRVNILIGPSFVSCLHLNEFTMDWTQHAFHRIPKFHNWLDSVA